MPSDIQDRDFMYRLMIRQLIHDGLQEVALSLTSSIGRLSNPPSSSGPLFRLVARALQFNKAEEQDDSEQEDDAEQEEEESRVPTIQMPFKMRYLWPFPMERLCFYLKSEILQQLDVDDVIELVKVNRGFKCMISNQPSIVFGRHVDTIRLFSQNGEKGEEIRIAKLHALFEIKLDVVLHFPLVQNIRSCRFLRIFSDRQLNKDYAPFLKQLEAVNELGLTPQSMQLSLVLSAKIKEDADLPSFVRKAPSLKDRVERFVETQLNECERVGFECENDDDFRFYYCASMKSHIKRVEFHFQENDKNPIVSAIRCIVSNGIPSKNHAANCWIGFDWMPEDVEATIVVFLTEYPRIKQISTESCRPLIALEAGRIHKYSRFWEIEQTFCFRQNIDSTRDCIYMLNSGTFFVFYIKPWEMIDP